jgi:hypothetical protein
MEVATKVITILCCCLASCLVTSCGPNSAAQRPSTPVSPVLPTLGFAPARIVITPLTEIKGPAQGDGKCQIRVFVKLVDSFESDVKAPGSFRFELYEKVPRSVEPRGRRLMLWPVFDLTVAEQNNVYWQDFLRSYEFILDLDPSNGGTYILEATFIPSEGKRLTAQTLLAASQ